MVLCLIKGSTGHEPPCIGLDIFQLTLLVNPNSLILDSLTKEHDLPRSASTRHNNSTNWCRRNLALPDNNTQLTGPICTTKAAICFKKKDKILLLGACTSVVLG